MREVEGGSEGLVKVAILPGLLFEDCGGICEWLRIGGSEGGSEQLGIVAIISGVFRGWWSEGGGSGALLSGEILLAGGGRGVLELLVRFSLGGKLGERLGCDFL